MNALAAVLVVAFIALFVGWLGLQVKPRPFASYPEESHDPPTVEMPSDLPGPVAEYYRAAYGERLPLVDAVIITGRGRIRPFGLWLPARFRFTHDAGRGYRHYIEATWFGLPFFKVNERYVDGESLMELPWGTSGGPKVEQAANIGMWAELASSAPSVFVSDARVRWKPLGDDDAVLEVPFGETAVDHFVVRFDRDHRRMAILEAMRYREATSEHKVLWIAAGVGDKTIGAAGTQAVGAATWLDQGRPWAFFEAEDVRYNVDVSDYIKQRGL